MRRDYEVIDTPLAWAAARGELVQNPVLNPPTDHPDWAIVPWYVAYGFNFINQYYANPRQQKESIP
jgi:hypothetical protein